MKNERGLTLIELLVSIVLLGVLLSAFTSVYVMGIKSYQREFRTTNLQSENRIVLDRIIADTKQAYKIDPASDGDTLILLVPAIDANGVILYDGTGQFKTDVLTYDKSGNEIMKSISPDISSSRSAVNKSIIQKVSGLTLTYIPDLNTAGEVTINLRTSDVSSGKTITINNISRAFLRNK